MNVSLASAMRRDWILEARGADGEPVPPSVLSQWQRALARSTTAQRRYAIIEISALIVSASIPALAAFALDARVIAAIGSLAVLINGLRALGGYKEIWTYRTNTRDSIELEIALFAAQHDRYAGDGAASALVETVGNIVMRERQGWAALRLSYRGEHGIPPTQSAAS
jgi:hypothetical protein